MTNVSLQKEIAARVLKCGRSRVWIDPSRIRDVEEAITTHDVRRFINDDVIKKLPKKGNSSSRKNKRRTQKIKGRRKGVGKRKGCVAGARKRRWVKRIRVIRRTLKELKNDGKLDNKTYWRMYRTAKSGFFRSKAHLISHLEKNDLLRKEEK